jgi:hypothetical protein
MTTATTNKVRPVEQFLIDEEGFYFAKVTMYRQDRMTGSKSDIVETYEGFIKQTASGIIYSIRPQASMRSHNKTEILTVSQRLISIETIKAGN